VVKDGRAGRQMHEEKGEGLLSSFETLMCRDTDALKAFLPRPQIVSLLESNR
jgi:hypothetical protein